ncbi:MAG: SGNH/GDSL hydrolase family protein [Afipia sp.]
MAIIQKQGQPWLYDDATGNIVGVKDPDGQDRFFAAFETSSDGVVLIGDAIATKKRAQYPVNLMYPTISAPAVQTNGTVTDSGGNPRAFTYTVSATGARIFSTVTVYGLDVNKWYEFTIGADTVLVASTANKVDTWLYVQTGYGSGDRQLTWATPPEAGKRKSLRFKPSASTVAVRFGIGLTGAEVAAAGDTLVLSGPSLYEIPSQADIVQDYSYSELGTAGRYQHATATLGSCIYAIGDSWSNDGLGAANGPEWPYWLSVDGGRECIVTALPGKRLDEIIDGVKTRLATGIGGLNLPNKNIPGVWVCAGGLNDIIQDVPAATIFARAATLKAMAEKCGAEFACVIQPLATDSGSYTSARLAQRNAYATLVEAAGWRFVDLQKTGFINPDGTANPAYFAGDKLHPIEAGSRSIVASGVEALARQIDAANLLVLNPPKFIL